MDTRHLTDGELCALAVPAASSPEALPAHLSDCLACTRALSEWKDALSAVADDAGPLDARTEPDWDRATSRTMERIRRSPRVHAGTSSSVRWAVGLAAALLLTVLSLPLRTGAVSPRSSAVSDRDRTELSGQDQADDALLRDVARMASADDDLGDPLDSLAPEPRAASNREGTL